MSSTAADRRMGESTDRKVASDPPIRPSAHPPVLESKAYSFWYGANHVLHDINVAIPPNAITALIGPSGCGKTTFLRSINRLHTSRPAPGIQATSCRRRVDICAGNGRRGAAPPHRDGVSAAQSVSQSV
jgi:ABC-type glutathione transport system ATPase component